MENLFNFDYGKGIRPNYRVEYEDGKNFSVSSPAVFDNDEEAVAAAMQHFGGWLKLGVNVAVVRKYTSDGLAEIWRNVS